MIFALGLIIGATLMALAFWLQRSGIIVKWYEWLLGGFGFVLGIWAVNDFFASIAEHNEGQGRFLLWVLGAPALILLGLVVFLVWRRFHSAIKATGLETNHQNA
jgi:hypothetical protein